MDPISRKLNYELAPADWGTSKAIEKKEEHAGASDDKVTLSSSSKTSKSRKSKPAKETKHKKETKSTEKAHRRESSGVQTYMRDDDPAPIHGRSCPGPDDVDDDGACPGGNRKDNMDNPDSVVDNGGCGSSYDSGNNNYSGPDGSFNYDEFH